MPKKTINELRTSYVINKELIDYLMNIKQECTGTTFITDKDYILYKGTTKDLEAIKKRAKH